MLQYADRLVGPQAAFERTLAINEKLYGPEHANVAMAVNNLSGVLRAKGDLDDAQAAFERALAINANTYGPEHANVAIRVNNLANILQDKGDLDGARAAFGRALAIFEALFGPSYPSTRTVRANLEALSGPKE